MNSNATNEPKRLRFLFTTTAHYGHFHPLVPTALALREAGHAVAFAVPRSLGPAVEAAGFQAFPAGLDNSDDPEYKALMGQLAQMPPGPESEIAIMTKVFFGLNPRRMIPDLVAICESWKPDLLIREAAEYGACIAAEYLGLPHVAISPGAIVQGIGFFEQKAAENLDPIRQEWGLAPDPGGEARQPYLFLNFAPPTFSIVNPNLPYPATTKFFHPEFWDRSGDETLPGWVTQLPGDRPTVYVTLGTVANNMPGIYPGITQTILEGLRDEPINLIITLGRDKDPADFGQQPANVHIERYIPQTLLMPFIDLLVMHGGSNSLLMALDRGLPLVIIPLIADQFMNAERCKEMQLGQAILQAQLTPESVRSATREVLANPLYRQNAGRLQTELHELPGLGEAVKLLEGIAINRTSPLQRF